LAHVCAGVELAQCPHSQSPSVFDVSLVACKGTVKETIIL